MPDLLATHDLLNLPPGFEYHADFLTVENHNSLFSALVDAEFWQQEPIQMFGKWVLQPRLTAYVGDSEARYSYAGAEQRIRPWTPELLKVRGQLEREVANRLALSGVSFNGVLLNAYRTGEDGMGWHQDNEPELGREPVIASLSLGASRRFSIRAKNGTALWDLILEPGSLLLMHGRSQVDFQHSLPKTRLSVAQRINLTFRQIKPKGPLRA